MQIELFDMKKNRKTYILLILSIAWALLIFYFCTMSSDKIPRLRIPHMDKVAHAGFFFVQSVFLSLLFNFQTKKSYFQIILLSTLVAFLYGGLIEVLQSKFFNRTGDLYDLIADVLGGFVGAMTYPTVLRIYRKVFKTDT
jgi:VanZ family protein